MLPKGRRVPVTLQDKADIEIDKQLAHRNLTRLIQSIFCLANRNHRRKEDGFIKLALKSRELKKQVHQNKYQMPNIKELVDTIGQLISEKKNRGNCILPRWT